MSSFGLFISTIVGVTSGPLIMVATPERHQIIGDVAAGLVFFICLAIGICLEIKKYNTTMEVGNE